MWNSGRLPFDEDVPPEGGTHENLKAAGEHPLDLPDRTARDWAVDPRFNVVLEASAGTGKTRVLVDRYVNLISAGVDPTAILAITFTRKAAAEMRQRIVARLREKATESRAEAARWRDLRDRQADIAISTIDAFCLSLLREFPLEADLDPGFTVADESEIPRLIGISLDRTIRICRAIARDDGDVALLFAQLGERRLRAGLSALLGRRLVAAAALQRFLAGGPRDLTAEAACVRGVERIRDALISVDGGLEPFLDNGPVNDPSYQVVAADIRELCQLQPQTAGANAAGVRAAVDRIRAYFVKEDRSVRRRVASIYRKADARSAAAWQKHGQALAAAAPGVADAIRAFHRDLNVVLSRGVWRTFHVALAQYRRTLEARAALDFSELLVRARDLLAQMDEFARSRYRLEVRYQHVLVDEFQDTSRAQWDLVSLLIRSWGEGFGLAHEAKLTPSIFIVGDRKQSIYGFRDAEVDVLREAAGFIAALRPEADEPQAISYSFRAVPRLLSFANALCREITKVPGRSDAFTYTERDEFPNSGEPLDDAQGPLGIIAAESPEACAAIVAEEISQLLATGVVRDRHRGDRRAVRPADIAVLFRSRESHREFEETLESRGIPAYVYKGLGFFDADEIKDLVALLRYLADPVSDLRAAAFFRSRLVHLSDEAIRLLAPRLAAALDGAEPQRAAALADDDRRHLDLARRSTQRWLALVERIPPSEVLDLVLADSAYAAETRGPRRLQARENIKKMRSLVRRIQNRGYATLPRIADHLDRLSAGDESNAVIDAVDAVNLMTVHAAKGLEFPIVFLVNLARGTGGPPAPIRIAIRSEATEPCVSVAEYQSPADEDLRAREREETKRLLYVAVTRARDRLYLASGLRDGKMRPTKGSLGEVLPTSLLDLFPTAAQSPHDSVVEWSGGRQTHRWRVCSLSGSTPGGPRVEHVRFADPGVPDARSSARWGGDTAHPVSTPRTDLFGPLRDEHAIPRKAVTAIVGDASYVIEDEPIVPAGASTSPSFSRDDQARIGSMVHALVQHWPVCPAAVAPGSRDDRLNDRALTLYRRLLDRPDFRALFDSGDRLHEVPFSARLDRQDLDALGLLAEPAPLIVRGSIDCLVLQPEGKVTIVELKTGRPRATDRLQMAVYERAVQAMFPESQIEAALVYVEEVPGAGC